MRWGGLFLFSKQESDLHNTSLRKTIVARGTKFSENLAKRAVDAQQARGDYITI